MIIQMRDCYGTHLGNGYPFGGLHTNCLSLTQGLYFGLKKQG